MGRRYQLLARKEESALAELFHARADGSAEVAIKLFRSQFSDQAYAQALADAGAHTRALGHPGALGFDEVGIVAGRLAAVRPYVDGYTLGEVLQRLSTKEVVLTPAVALYLVGEAAQVLAAAHARELVHGALTPGNILLGKDGRVRLVDFGALQAMQASPALAELARKGRGGYRAPEQKGEQAEPAADVYSLGAVAYELLTLRAVADFRDGGLSTKRDALTPPSRLDRRINQRIDPMILRSLDLAATRRFKSGAELLEALRATMGQLGWSAGATEAARFAAELFPSEVVVRGDSSALPLAGPFELNKVESSLTAAGFKLPEQRTSFSAPAQAAKEVAAEPEPPAPAPPPAAAPQATEEWVAPPGKMDSGPRLRTKQARQRPEPEPEQPPKAEQIAPISAARFQAQADDGDPFRARVSAKTLVDWHPPPMEPPKPKSRVAGFRWSGWLIAIAAAALAAWLVYYAAGRKLGVLREAPEHVHRTKVEAEPARQAPAEERGESKLMGSLTLQTDHRAKVIIDGKDTGLSTPLVRHPLAAGSHEVRLVDGDRSRELKLTIRAGEELHRSETLSRKPGK